MGSTKVFAVWKSIPTNRATRDLNDPLLLRRDQSIEVDAVLFVVDIPKEAGREVVETRASPYVDASPNFPGETVESGFDEDWPPDVEYEFRHAGLDLKRSWSTL
jgi:hypothetical protein